MYLKQTAQITAFSSFAIIYKHNVAGILIIDDKKDYLKDENFIDFLIDFSISHTNKKNWADVYFVYESDMLFINHHLEQEIKPVNQLLIYKDGRTSICMPLKVLHKIYLDKKEKSKEKNLIDNI